MRKCSLNYKDAKVIVNQARLNLGGPAEESCLLWSKELENECLSVAGGEKYLNDEKEASTNDAVVPTEQTISPSLFPGGEMVPEKESEGKSRMAKSFESISSQAKFPTTLANIPEVRRPSDSQSQSSQAKSSSTKEQKRLEKRLSSSLGNVISQRASSPSRQQQQDPDGAPPVRGLGRIQSARGEARSLNYIGKASSRSLHKRTSSPPRSRRASMEGTSISRKSSPTKQRVPEIDRTMRESWNDKEGEKQQRPPSPTKLRATEVGETAKSTRSRSISRHSRTSIESLTADVKKIKTVRESKKKDNPTEERGRRHASPFRSKRSDHNDNSASLSKMRSPSTHGRATGKAKPVKDSKSCSHIPSESKEKQKISENNEAQLSSLSKSTATTSSKVDDVKRTRSPSRSWRASTGAEIKDTVAQRCRSPSRTQSPSRSRRMSDLKAATEVRSLHSRSTVSPHSIECFSPGIDVNDGFGDVFASPTRTKAKTLRFKIPSERKLKSDGRIESSPPIPAFETTGTTDDVKAVPFSSIRKGNATVAVRNKSPTRARPKPQFPTDSMSLNFADFAIFTPPRSTEPTSKKALIGDKCLDELLTNIGPSDNKRGAGASVICSPHPKRLDSLCAKLSRFGVQSKRDEMGADSKVLEDLLNSVGGMQKTGSNCFGNGASVSSSGSKKQMVPVVKRISVAAKGNGCPAHTARLGKSLDVIGGYPQTISIFDRPYCSPQNSTAEAQKDLDAQPCKRPIQDFSSYEFDDAFFSSSKEIPFGTENKNGSTDEWSKDPFALVTNNISNVELKNRDSDASLGTVRTANETISSLEFERQCKSSFDGGLFYSCSMSLSKTSGLNQSVKVTDEMNDVCIEQGLWQSTHASEFCRRQNALESQNIAHSLEKDWPTKARRSGGKSGNKIKPEKPIQKQKLVSNAARPKGKQMTAQ